MNGDEGNRPEHVLTDLTDKPGGDSPHQETDKSLSSYNRGFVYTRWPGCSLRGGNVQAEDGEGEDSARWRVRGGPGQKDNPGKGPGVSVCSACLRKAWVSGVQTRGSRRAEMGEDLAGTGVGSGIIQCGAKCMDSESDC